MEKPNYYAIIPANVRYDNELTPNAKLLYGEITALCNKQGYCCATNEYFSQLYNVSKASISKWISLLIQNGYLISETKYKEGTKEILNRYLIIVKYPIKEKFKDNNTSINKENIIINNNIKESSKKFKKPTIEEIKQYCSERNNKIDAEYFYDYYESNGWKVGKNPMKDWQATIRTWERNNKKYNTDFTFENEIEQEPKIESKYNLVDGESEEDYITRHHYAYVAGACNKEYLESLGIPLPTEKEYADIKSRI